MENSIYAIEAKSVAMKILRENIIWHWFHFIEKTKRYETKQNEMKKWKRRRREKNIYLYGTDMYIVLCWMCVRFSIYCALSAATRVTVFLKQWSFQCALVVCAIYVTTVNTMCNPYSCIYRCLASSSIIDDRMRTHQNKKKITLNSNVVTAFFPHRLRTIQCLRYILSSKYWFSTGNNFLLHHKSLLSAHMVISLTSNENNDRPKGKRRRKLFITNQK